MQARVHKRNCIYIYVYNYSEVYTINKNIYVIKYGNVKNEL